MAYQVADVVAAMAADSGVPLDVLRVDGGAARNDRLCQFQADLLGRARSSGRSTPRRPRSAPRRWPGWLSGCWSDPADFAATRAIDRRFEPAMTADRRATLLHGWHRAVERSLGWVEPG